MGFSLGYDGNHSVLASNNSVSANTNPKIVLEKVQCEISLGRIAGPFTDPPFDLFKCSPLALREKSCKGKYRLLHNLSYPYNHEAVNFNISDDHAKVSYAKLSDAFVLVRKFNNCFMAKSDIADAFRLIPLNPNDYNLTGFKFGGQFYYDRCLPMGARSSCLIFERFSNALKFILENVYKVPHVVKVLDDFLFIAESFGECLYALECFKTMCSRLGVPIAVHKTVGPTQSIDFLGISIDSVAYEASVPKDKIDAYSAVVSKLLTKDTCTLREMRSVIGKLQFTTCVISSGRCFLRRLYDTTIGKSNPNCLVFLTDEVKQDLHLWLSFLCSFNGKSLLVDRSLAVSPDIHLYSDSSKTGYGGTFMGKYILGLFPSTWQEYSIAVLELYPIFLLVKMFASEMAYKTVIFHCDNEAIVTIINKQTSKNRRIMKLLRPMVLELLKFNVVFKSEHIPGLQNNLCDALSRQQVSEQLLRRHGLGKPTTVPFHLRPCNFKI